MQKPLIVITGKNGQLGFELFRLHSLYTNEYDFLFTGRDDLDLGKPETIPAFFEKHTPQFFINCAAYTAVDKAETEKELAYTVNAISVGEIAKASAAINCKLITISTDYVFNGNGTAPYLPTDATEPVNHYGYTKRAGEELALKHLPSAIIIRTSWVYSSHGNNFVKTMMRLMKDRAEINVVNDQLGAPTYAKDLADAIFKIIPQSVHPSTKHTIYHFSNAGMISWYDFALAIKANAGLTCAVNPIPTSQFPTPAKRPGYSLLDKQSIVDDFAIELTDWKLSLQKCIAELM